MMDDKELIQTIQEFKSIKPTKEWVFWLKSNITREERKTGILRQPQFQLTRWSFLSRPAVRIAIPSILGVLAVFSFAFAQFSLPGSPLYSLKTFSQEMRIAVAPANQKPLLKIKIAKARIADLIKVRDNEKEVALSAQNTQKMLETVPKDIKNISSNKVALLVSRQVQENTKNIHKLIDKTQLSSQGKTQLNKTAQNTQKQVLTYIMDTTEAMNHCPSYLESQLVDLENYFANKDNVSQNWSLEDIVKVHKLLNEVSDNLKSGDCLKAKEATESINHLLLIHSESNSVEPITTTPSSD